MQNIRIKSTCKVFGVDRPIGAIVENVPDAIAQTLAILGRAEIVAPVEVQHRDPEPETRDPETGVAKRKPK